MGTSGVPAAFFRAAGFRSFLHVPGNVTLNWLPCPINRPYLLANLLSKP